MKDYFTKTIHEEPNLLIGTNGKSLIFGQNDEWIIVDKAQIGKIEKHFSTGTGALDLPGLYCKQINDSICMSQLGSLVAVKKELLNRALLK